MVYPPLISRRLAALKRPVGSGREDASGKEVNFECGSFIRFSLKIVDRTVCEARFATNGCGFMVAFADVLAEYVTNKELGDLHGLQPDELGNLALGEFESVPQERRDCLTACIDALRRVFLNYRSRQIEEFRGEKAIICTCFGVTEEIIERVVQERGVDGVSDVTARCRAAGGCGACTMIIQEILDNRTILPLS